MQDKNSILSTGDNEADFDFLFKDYDLEKVTLIADFQTQNQDTGVASINQNLTFKCEEGLPIYTSQHGQVIAAKENDNELGTYVKIKYNESDIITYSCLKYISDDIHAGSTAPDSDCASSYITKGIAIGGCTAKLIVTLERDNDLVDPSIIWPGIKGKKSDTRSLGNFVLEGKSKVSAFSTKDSVSVGLQDTDGTYNMDNLNNYFFDFDNNINTKSNSDIIIEPGVIHKVSVEDIGRFARNSKESLLEKAYKNDSDKSEIMIYLHWSAGHYDKQYPESYHINIDNLGNIYIDNEDLSVLKNHTYHRNSGAIGIALDCAYNATPNDLGEEPPTEQQINTMAKVVSVLCKELDIPITPERVMTHGEAANIDGYGLGQDDDCRWDLLVIDDTGVSGGDKIRSLASGM